MAADGGEPDPLVVLQVSNQDAAGDGLQAVLQCTGEENSGIAFVGDYALVAETQELADQFAADAEEAPLSEDSDYTADVDALAEQGIVSAWVDVDAVVDEYLSEEDQASAAAAGLSDISSVAMSVRAGSDNIEVGVAADGVPSGGGQTAEAIQTLPETTMVALGFTGGAEAIDEGWSQLSERMEETQPGAVQELTSKVQASTGLVLPDDVATLLGDDFALALDSEGIGVGEYGQPDPSTIRFGVRTSSDIEAVADLAGRIETALTPFAPLDLVEREVDGGSVLASNEEYADALTSDGGLGDSDNYRAAVADPDDSAAVFYLDFDQMLSLVDRLGEQAGDEQLAGDEREALAVLRAFGFSATVDGDYTKATARLVFD